MHPHRRSDQVKLARITNIRPGIVEAFMQPASLKNQVRHGTTRTNLKFTPTGKNLVGGTQWTISLQRPGLAKPLIMARQEQQALEKGLAQDARITALQAKGMSITAKAKAAQVDITEDAVADIKAGLGRYQGYGYGSYYGVYGSDW